MNFKIFILGASLLFLSIVKGFTQCNCDFTIPTGTSTYTFDGVAKGAKPGDVICISAGSLQRIVFQNLKGSSTDYIKITNCGGQAVIGSSTANGALNFSNCQFIHLTGSGDPTHFYGIKIPETASSAQGVSAYNLSSDFEIDHLEITKVGFAGIMIKSDPSKDCANTIYERPNFTMRNIHIHDNYIYDIAGEGVYCGNSFYNGTTVYCGSTQYPHEVRSVNIHDNIFKNTGWESIQVGSGVDDINIYDNKITNYGAANVSGQNGGIQLGSGSTGKIYNNMIKGGSGRAIFMGGIGNYFIFNNVLVNTGVAGSSAGIAMSLTKTPLSTDIVSQNFVGPVRIINNTFVNETYGAIKESLQGPLGNVLFNNLIVGGTSSWLSLRGDTDWSKSNNIYIANIADAKFVNPSMDDYNLQTSSPAVNTGKDVSMYGITFDHENKPRPVGDAWDVGAFELAGNLKPSVSVGANQTITLPTNSTTLTGSATDADGTISSYLWTKQSGPSAILTNSTTTTLSVSDLVAGTYIFRLTATDNGGETGFKDVTITVVEPTVVNQPPVANAGGNKSITLPTNSMILNGSGNDADGTTLIFSWIKVIGPAATLANFNTAALSLTNLVEGIYIFRLTVTDDKGATDFNDATVTVQAATTANQNPVANAGVDKNLVFPTNSATIVGSGSDADGSIISYTWTKQSGGSATLTNANSATLQLSGLSKGTYIFRLTVKDDKAATGFDEMTVLVSSANKAPVAKAGTDKTLQLPTNYITLTGSASDSDGTISSYRWKKVSGPAATLKNANTRKLSLSNLVKGSYVFRFAVTDNVGNTSFDLINVIVKPTPLIVHAGPDKTIILPNSSIILWGTTQAYDSNITYSWTKQRGPSVSLSGTTTNSLNVSALLEGQYIFRLTVTDSYGLTAYDEMELTVTNSNNGSIEQMIEMPAEVYPNPFVDRITISYESRQAEVGVSVSDLAGRLVYHEIHKDDALFTIDLSQITMAPGLYILTIQSVHGKDSRKIIKQ